MYSIAIGLNITGGVLNSALALLLLLASIPLDHTFKRMIIALLTSIAFTDFNITWMYGAKIHEAHIFCGLAVSFEVWGFESALEHLLKFTVRALQMRPIPNTSKFRAQATAHDHYPLCNRKITVDL